MLVGSLRANPVVRAPSSLSASVLAGRYSLGKVLGTGGMSLVYKARDELLRQDVALKVLRPELRENPRSERRFMREAEVLASVRHPNVVSVLDCRESLGEDQPSFIALELLSGMDLWALSRRQTPFALPRLLGFAIDVCQGLSALHERGIVHRDLKPENLFVTKTLDGRETVKILDLGVAYLTSDGPIPSDSGEVGSPGYLSPEQLTGSAVLDGRADLWALGVILYELLTDTAPFEGATSYEVSANVLRGAYKPLRQLRPDIPAALCRAVERCLEPKAKNRFESATALARSLCMANA
jgi:serine/threonine protein kinase